MFKTNDLQRAVHNAHKSRDQYFNTLKNYAMRIWEMPADKTISVLTSSLYLRAFILATVHWTSYQNNDLETYEPMIEVALNNPYEAACLLDWLVSDYLICAPGKEQVATMYKRVLAAERLEVIK